MRSRTAARIVASSAGSAPAATRSPSVPGSVPVGKGSTRDEEPRAGHETRLDGVSQIDVGVVGGAERPHRREAALEKLPGAIGAPERALRRARAVVVEVVGNMHVGVDEAWKQRGAAQIDCLDARPRGLGAHRDDLAVSNEDDDGGVPIAATVEGEIGPEGDVLRRHGGAAKEQENERSHGRNSRSEAMRASRRNAR